jgi:hypothetical protein
MRTADPPPSYIPPKAATAPSRVGPQPPKLSHWRSPPAKLPLAALQGCGGKHAPGNPQRAIEPDYAAAELDSAADDAGARPAPQAYIQAGTAAITPMLNPSSTGPQRAAAAPSRVGPQLPQLEAIAWDESIEQAAPQMHRSLNISEMLTRFEMDNCTPLNIPELQRGDVAELPDKTPLASQGELKHCQRQVGR